MGIINERIKERRLAAGLTLAEVADYLGVKEATAQRYESGAIKNISHETVCKLATILHCSPAYLMGWEKDVEEAETVYELLQRDNSFYSFLLRVTRAYSKLDDASKGVIDSFIDDLLKPE